MRLWLNCIQPLLAEVKAGRMPEVRRMGRRPAYVACPHCGRKVTLTEKRRGHEGCSRVIVRRAKQTRKPKALEIVLPFTKEEIRRRIEAMPQPDYGRLTRKLMLR